jgi:phospholipid/cholesterol/gamma-HCH transport system substrate-binding protein
MDERILQFRVGVMVAATLLITAILIATFGDLPDLVYGSKTYHIWVDQAPGVQTETPIRKSGILIGRVADVRLADDYDGAEEASRKLGIPLERFRGGVVITASIQADRRIYADETFVVNATLLGDVVIEVKKRGNTVGGPLSPAGNSMQSASAGAIHTVSMQQSPPADGQDVLLPENAWIEGEARTDPAQGLQELQRELPRVFSSVQRTSDELNELIRSVNRLLTDNRTNIDDAIQQTNETMTSVRRLADNANTIIGDPQTQQDLRHAMDRLPRMLEDVHETVISVQSTVGKMNTSLGHIESFTRPLGDRGEKLVSGLDGSIEKLDQLLAELVQFTGAMNDRRGSLGRLIHDPTLYENVNQTILQVKCLTRKLEPIIDDARVFSDKVARHPGVIVRDAVRPGNGLK